MGTEGQVCTVMEGSPPEAANPVPDQHLYARQHGSCGFVCECGQQNSLRRNTAFDKTGYSIGQCPCFPASGSCDDQKRPLLFKNNPTLLRIEFFFVIDHPILTSSIHFIWTDFFLIHRKNHCHRHAGIRLRIHLAVVAGGFYGSNHIGRTIGQYSEPVKAYAGRYSPARGKFGKQRNERTACPVAVRCSGMVLLKCKPRNG